jgi:hypothetical protein
VKTEGLSPKAYLPFLALVAAGVVTLALGETEAGLALLAAAVGQGSIAVAANPGKVVEKPTPPDQSPA